MNKMDCCGSVDVGSPDVKKKKFEEKDLLEKTGNNCEKVATCVPHILRQVVIKTDLNAEDKDIKVSTMGKSVSDIRKESERRKLLRLGFVPTQDEKSSVNNTAVEDNFSSSVDQSRRSRARLNLLDKPSISELVSN